MSLAVPARTPGVPTVVGRLGATNPAVVNGVFVVFFNTITPPNACIKLIAPVASC